jgi:Nucleotidyl transferase AbiEii toxin, Type IV TA system
LRPEIETSVWPMRKPSIDRPLRSLIAEAFDRPPEVASIACAAIAESAAEKLVALTRRAGAQLAGLRQQRDPTLVRHVLDLHAICEQYDPGEVAALAREIMVDDAQTYGADFPAYQADPLTETLKAINGIAADQGFANDYAAFRRDMVYGEAPDFQTAMATLQLLAQHLQQG